MYILTIDGDDSLVHKVKGGCSWSGRVLKMMEACPFDRGTGRWVIWKPESDRLSWAASAGDMLQAYTQPLLDVFAFARWDDGAISRWTGVMKNLKKIVVGACYNNVLLDAVAALASNMELTEAKVNKGLEECRPRACCKKGEACISL